MSEPLQSALLAVIELVPAAKSALAEAGAHLDASQRKAPFKFSGKLDDGKVFHDRDLEELERLLKPLQKIIRDGERTEVIVDEGYVDESWIQTILIPEARELQETCAPLFQLRDALRHVRDLRRVDRIYSQLAH
ncbi:hypothetical protein SAMN05421853_1065 [Roseivivax halotolerans]|uniref:Uncharacterized protein n=1 Tax=Roseivivax halotolerans TaxID=93684 RepID=A0A1I5YJL0_9RHOB|nr:hypothetical protein [Roseivivax halotolerans]SFQ44416.1 hypothetical protein SAMN05421853_1065 [Roseivivax halotolerans]